MIRPRQSMRIAGALSVQDTKLQSFQRCFVPGVSNLFIFHFPMQNVDYIDYQYFT